MYTRCTLCLPGRRVQPAEDYKMARTKHPKDGNHGKRGWVSGNPRYSRAKAKRMLDTGRRYTPKLVSMGAN